MSKDVAFLKTDRGKAIIKLSFYILFFIIVFIFIKPGNRDYVEPINALDKYSKMTNYEYTYKYDDLMIEGKVYRDNILFNMNDVTYYYNGNIYKVLDNKLTLDELDSNYYINNHTISNYITKGNIIGKNEDYENHIISTTYGINDMHIIVFEKDNSIYKVNIEIKGDESHLIEINYTNVNQVKDFTLDLVKE